MKKMTLVSLKLCLILVIVLAISASSLADIASATNKKAEQYFEKANELLKRMDYEAAIAEYNKVINLSSNSKIAQDAQYWIGQSHFRAGQFDAAKETFAKLLEQYPASAIVPVTKLMVERVGQEKANEEKRRAMRNTADKGFIVDPRTGAKYTKTRTFSGKRDVIKYTNSLNLSPNGRFLLQENLVIPLESGDPFELVDMPAGRGTWSTDGKKAAFYSNDGIWVVPVSPDTGHSTGPPKKLLDGKYMYAFNVSWSPDGQKFAFQREDEEISGDIWTISVRDGSLTQITRTPDVELAPAWSPNGKTIAYGRCGKKLSLWLSSVDGETARKIIDTEHRGVPIWSPDGKWIFLDERYRLISLADKKDYALTMPKEVGNFFSFSPDGNKMLFYRGSYGYQHGLKLVSASGGPPLDIGRQIASYGAAVWSSDSEKIAVQGGDKDGNIVIWIIPLSGSDPVPLEIDVSVDGKPFVFEVSPTGDKLAFVVKHEDGRQDLYVVPISLRDARTTGPAVKVFEGWNRKGGINAEASWSPDGTKLAVIHNMDIWISPSNGDKPVQLTKTPKIGERYPGWSPDGKMVNYMGWSEQETRGAFYVIPSFGGKPTKITGAYRNSAWSPDSKKLAIVSEGSISIVTVADGETQEIADLNDLNLDRVFYLGWSPDGKYIACVGNHIEKGHSGPIFVIPVEGGEATMLVTDDNSWKYSISWSPDGRWIAYDPQGPVKVRPEGTMWAADFEEIIKKASR